MGASDVVNGLWLEVLQRAMARASHDVKDAINGVSVNLEVIRSRAARPDTPATAVAKFGEAAAHQLERLTNLIEAALALGRPEREPVDVALTLRRIVVICGASSSASDAIVRLEEPLDGDMMTTRMPGSLVRLALMSPLLDAVSAPGHLDTQQLVICSLHATADLVSVRIDSPRRHPVVPARVAGALRAEGIRWTETEHDLSLAFPRS